MGGTTGPDASEGDEDTASGDENEEVEEVAADHLEDIDDGSGCTEIWEKLAEQRHESDE